MPMREEQDQGSEANATATIGETAEAKEEDIDISSLLDVKDNSLILTRPTNDSDRGKELKRLPPNYKCSRCQGYGHSLANCPHLNNPAYDKKKSLTGIPKDYMKEVTSLDGIDTSNKVSTIVSLLLSPLPPSVSLAISIHPSISID